LLIELEAMLITLTGLALALLGLWLAISQAQDYLSDQYGLFISTDFYSSDVGVLLLLIFAATLVMALLPALNAYRRSVQAGVNNF
jgi:putative ABC transport system permease protein